MCSVSGRGWVSEDHPKSPTETVGEVLCDSRCQRKGGWKKIPPKEEKRHPGAGEPAQRGGRTHWGVKRFLFINTQTEKDRPLTTKGKKIFAKGRADVKGRMRPTGNARGFGRRRERERV